MCDFILTLFYGEKLKDVLCLCDFCLVCAETGNFLQSATFYTHFSESKRWPKDFRRSNAAAKAKLHLWLACFCLFGAETGYPLPCATLFSDFSESKKVGKRFSPLKRRSESVASSPHIKLSSVKFSCTSKIPYLRSQMLRTARWGWVLSKICLSQL